MSPTANALNAYFQLAQTVEKANPDSITRLNKSLQEKASGLPHINQPNLQALAQCAAETSHQSPRLGWAIMAAADAAARQQDDPFLAAQAAWHLGRAANEFGRPKLVKEAVDRAEAGFQALDEGGWLAATIWLRYGLAWAVGDLNEADKALETAVHTLQDSPPPLSAFAPHCQLSLAYIKLVKGDLDPLPDLLDQCEAHFAANGDRLSQARTCFVRSGYLRRTAPFQEAIAASEKGLVMVEELNATADIGRFQCQIGFNNWLGKGDYQASEQSFKVAINHFKALDIPGWLAQCQDGLAQIYIMTGRLSEADQALQSALTNFKEEAILGQLPSIYFAASWLERTRGNHQKSLEYLQQCQTTYQAIGNQQMLPVVLTGLGDTYLQLGRFQQALQCMEDAYGRLKAADNDFRLAECGLRLARLWTRLNDPKQALYYLEKVKEQAQRVEHASALLAYYLRTAEFHNNQGSPALAMEALIEALELAGQQDNPNLEILCRRQLAKAYSQQGRFEEAVEQLTAAETGIQAMGLQHEQAACGLIWGDIYQRQGRHDEAKAAWQEAARLSQTIMPDLNWQAEAALAGLAEDRGDKEEALARYRQMLESLRLLRQGFWQPELAGGYLKRPSNWLNRAVLLSAQSGRHQETLTFIEETKAQTTARQLQAQTLFQHFNLMHPKARQMMAEIRWLQENLRTPGQGQDGLFRSAVNGERFDLLRDKMTAYTQFVNRLQRQQLDSSQVPVNDRFDVEQFRRQADQHLGQRWVALDYYRVGSQLVCLMLTPDGATAHPINLPQDLASAMNRLSWLKNINGRAPVPVLKGAGAVLFPAALQDYLEPDTTLIIAPHRDLHRLPWAALHINGQKYRPLVDAATPVIVPSLQTLSLLWQRPARPFSPSNGLLLAVSTFQDRHADLAAVPEEVTRLRPFLGQNGRFLLDDGATAEAMLAMMADSPELDFWHIASHAFHDGQSGRLSGLALHDRDFLLDEFWQLAPLPNLVTFSACGSSKSFLFEGDEHIGLPTTCLTAGANHVIGSIWNVLDSGMAGIMADFYGALQEAEGETAVPVSYALAQAQRLAWKSDQSWREWAGFRCTGRP